MNGLCPSDMVTPNATQTTRTSDQRVVYCGRPIKKMVFVLPGAVKVRRLDAGVGPRRDGGKSFRWIDCLAMAAERRKDLLVQVTVEQ